MSTRLFWNVLLGVAIVALSSKCSIAAFFIGGLDNGSNAYPIGGVQPWEGQLGDDFLVGSSDLKITQVAVFDSNGDGTSKTLVWQLFNADTGVRIHEEPIAATSTPTGGNTVESNYVFKTLTTPLILQAGTRYSAVAYGFDNDNKNFNTNYDLANYGVSFSNIGLTGGDGRWSNPGFDPLVIPGILSPDQSTNGSQDYNFGAASFVYSAVPEAGSFLVIGLGGIFALGAVGLGKRFGISAKL